MSMEQMSDRKMSVGRMLMDKMSFGQISVSQLFALQNICKQMSVD